MAILAGGPLNDSAFFVFGAPGAVSAIVVYWLARRERPAWALGAALVTPAWAFVLYVALLIIVKPD